MSEINYHEPAFPQPMVDNQGRIDSSNDYGYGGMSLRDYFAAQAMNQLCRNGDDAEATAHYAYQYADAMLKERLQSLPKIT
jgi:hypothetical protein